ncbi:DRMBL-domain-containing protein [Trichocladium antarcticum]|uniref:DRMBL-domain-containing protein n=1 Tax=Trichocladium antarcticum TaxID=1450529 RepID=A0AAN6ZBG8_9PEZI|nr:DRMBL-domain-containing protein [Trichocladium antarcticum]
MPPPAKLSQPRAAKTPTKSGARSSSLSLSLSSAKTKPRGVVKARPNQSILRFFKRAADESLFVEGAAPAEGDAAVGAGGDGDEEGEGEKGGGDDVAVSLDDVAGVEGGGRALKRVVRKRTAGNPFLDDESSSSGEDDDDDDTRLRGPARLTNGGWSSREVLLQKEETSGVDLENDDDDDDDDDLVGEEFNARRYMEEQAELEAEEECEVYNGDDGEAMAESCPICYGSLAGITAEQATAHVNACLDGNPTPFPEPPDTAVDTAVGRSAKAAVARPGQANPIAVGDDAEGSTNSAFARLMSGHAEDTAWATAAATEKASRGMPAYKRTCPFYKIMPGFSICVDAFRYGAVEGCRAYFLSHFHSDHYIGLTANWTHGPIYCSKVTGSLVKSQLKTAAKYVVELEFEETVPVPDTNGVTVTMIPANHCPGSSLFLFEKSMAGSGRAQRILHCGDFRACPAHVAHPRLRAETVDAISGKTKQQTIDVCYLDTTYLNPRYSFPPQSDVVNACAELCVLLNKSLLANDDSTWDALLRRGKRGSGPSGPEDVSKFFTTTAAAAAATASSSSPSSPSNPPAPAPASSTPTPANAFTALTGPPPSRNRLLVLCGTYSIGKERLCIAIAHALNTKIYAPPAKLRICTQLADPALAALLTPDPRAAQVHMHALAELRADALAAYLAAHRDAFGRVVAFRPSGWNYRPPPPPPPPNKTAGKQRRGAGAAVATTTTTTAEFLHGDAWRGRFGVRDLVPQRGAGGGRGVMCFGVPYSEHSSFWELGVFLMALRIERVVPTVNVGNEGVRRKMRGWVESLVRGFCTESAIKHSPTARPSTKRKSARDSPLLVASSSSGVSTALAGRCTYLTTEPRMKTFLTALCEGPLMLRYWSTLLRTPRIWMSFLSSTVTSWSMSVLKKLWAARPQGGG